MRVWAEHPLLPGVPVREQITVDRDDIIKPRALDILWKPSTLPNFLSTDELQPCLSHCRDVYPCHRINRKPPVGSQRPCFCSELPSHPWTMALGESLRQPCLDLAWGRVFSTSRARFSVSLKSLYQYKVYHRKVWRSIPWDRVVSHGYGARRKKRCKNELWGMRYGQDVILVLNMCYYYDCLGIKSFHSKVKARVGTW